MLKYLIIRDFVIVDTLELRSHNLTQESLRLQGWMGRAFAFDATSG